VSQTVGGCTSPVAAINASPLIIPSVSLAPYSDVCIDDPAFNLSGGFPSGGVYAGTGVSLGSFDPLTASYGTFLITYTYTDINTCSAESQQTITVGCAGVGENVEASLSVHPNPSNGIFIIQLGETKMNWIKILDQTGRVIHELTLNSDTVCSIDLSSHAKGVYTVLVHTEKGLFNERIVLTEL
jgi:hypothetical protein